MRLKLKKDCEDYVRELGFEPLGPVCPGYPVFKASKDGFLFTVKFGDEHVKNENRVLDRIGRVDGVVEKVSFHEFKDDKLVALIRKYVEGETLADTKRKIVYPDVLVNAINTLHENGIATGDLADYNIVLDPIGKPVIIDLGACSFIDEIGEETFGKGKEYDSGNLEWILKEYT